MALSTFYSVVGRRQSYTNILFILLDMILATAGFAISLTFFSVGLTLVFILVGLLLIGIWLYSLRSLAVIERFLTRVFLDVRIEPPPARPTGFWANVRLTVGTVETLRLCVYYMLGVKFFWNSLTFTLMMGLIGLTLLSVAWPIYFLVADQLLGLEFDDDFVEYATDWLGLAVNSFAGSLVMLVLGAAVAFPLTLHFCGVLAYSHTLLSNLFLGQSRRHGTGSGVYHHLIDDTNPQAADYYRPRLQQPESSPPLSLYQPVGYYAGPPGAPPVISTNASAYSPVPYVPQPEPRLVVPPPGPPPSRDTSAMPVQRQPAPAKFADDLAAAGVGPAVPRPGPEAARPAPSAEPPVPPAVSFEKSPATSSFSPAQVSHAQAEYEASLVASVRRRLESGGLREVMMLDKGGFAILHHAAAQGHTSVLRAIVEFCQEQKMVPGCIPLSQVLNQRDAHGNTILHWAARYHHYPTLAYILSLKHPRDEGGGNDLISGGTLINVNAFNSVGDRALHCAVRGPHANADSVRSLLRHGSLPNLSNAAGDSPLLIAVASGDVEIARQLVDANADIRMRNTLTNTNALMLAIMLGHTEMQAFLLERDIKETLGDTDNNGWTPLHWAAATQNVDSRQGPLITRLVQSGSRVAAQANDGKTPLHLAAREGYVRNCKLLLDNGASIVALDKYGRAPLELALPYQQLPAFKPLAVMLYPAHLLPSAQAQRIAAQ